MSRQSFAGAANVLLTIEQHIAANLAEVEQDIAKNEAQHVELIARRDKLRAVARAAQIAETEQLALVASHAEDVA